jgi:TRAP-type C4-dicarboxylate transport system permease small subunit
MKDLFLKLDRYTTSFSMAVACAMLALAACLGLFQIITRFVLEQPAEWTEVLIRFSLIWMVFMGIPMAFRQGAMVSVDVLHRMVKPGMRRALEWLVCTASLLLVGIMVWKGVDYAWRGRVQSISGLEDYSMFWAYLAMPVGGMFAAIGIIGNALDPKRQELETAQ